MAAEGSAQPASQLSWEVKVDTFGKRFREHKIPLSMLNDLHWERCSRTATNYRYYYKGALLLRPGTKQNFNRKEVLHYLASIAR